MEICGVEELPPGSMKGIEYENRRILVTNCNGRLYALEGTCTHEDADLSMGFLVENRLTCPLHLSMFDIVTGKALNPPATEPLKAFKVKISDSRIYVEI